MNNRIGYDYFKRENGCQVDMAEDDPIITYFKLEGLHSPKAGGTMIRMKGVKKNDVEK